MLKEKLANESHYHFVCGEHNPDKFQVSSFEGIDSIFSLYNFVVELQTSMNDIDPNGLINKPATLFIFREGSYVPYSGIVKEFEYIGEMVDQVQYRAVLVPKLSVLNCQVQTRIFQKKSCIDIIKEVLDVAGLQGYYTMDLARNYPAQEFVLQYQESDLNFISRLLESSGAWYFFMENQVDVSAIKPGGTVEKLVITDKPSAFSAIPGDDTLWFRGASGLVERDDIVERESVHSLKMRQVMTSKEILVKNYNYRTPEVNLSSKAAIPDGTVGSVYEFGGNAKNISETQVAVKNASNRIASGRIAASGASNCRAFRAGCRFTLIEHTKQELNDAYVVLKVTHSGGHDGDVPTYNNIFSALPVKVANSFGPQQRMMDPKVNGVMSAMIETNGSPYAALDDAGRYKVRMMFDNSSVKNSEASKSLRLSQPYAGSKYGMHFPSHEGTEMLWACINGDPNKPVGLGVVPNANTISPVVSANKAQNIIRTAGANELLMDDTDTKQKVHLQSSAKNVVAMDDGEKRLFLQSTDKNQVLLDDKNERVELTAKQHTIVMDYKSGNEAIVLTTAGGHVIRIDDTNKSITIQSKDGSAIQIDDNKKSIVMKDSAGKNTVTLDGNKGLSLDSQGKIIISAQQDIEIKGANIKLTAQSAIEAKATADLKLKGMNIDAKADMNAKVNAGMNLELKGGMQTKLDGMMTEVSGATMAKVKGAIVMIN